MPLPKPHDGESEKDFIARCMGDETMMADFDDQDQRSGVCFSQWRGKESKEASMVTKLSAKNIQTILQQALIQEYKIGVQSPIPKELTIDEVYDDHVVYNIDGQLYQSNYELDENGAATFGEPAKVTSTKIFKSMESLQTTYSEVIQEAGKRNAILDAARVKKIVELCQELLSSEAEPEEKDTKEALKEAKAVLKWLKTQEAEKTEDNVQFPSQAYAYVPDVETSSGWKLRLWEDLEKKVTRAQLGRAAAALSPDGFRGQKVAIPAADLSAVKRKIRSAYRTLSVEVEDMPRSVRESWSDVPGKGTVWQETEDARVPILNFVNLTEAQIDDKDRATVIVIKPGFNATEDRYYPAEMLKRDFGIFEGAKMFADHPTEAEDKELPERSIKASWVAVLKDVKVDEVGVVTGVAVIIEGWLKEKLGNLRDKGLLSEMGISINAIGKASKETIEGKDTLVIEELTGVRSVDFVTEPGAGGIVTLYEVDRSNDIDLVSLSVLKEHRPDLVKLIEATVREEIAKEVRKAMESEERITELEGQVATLTTENGTLKEAQEQAEKDKAKAEAQATIKEAVDKAELPDAAKAVLLTRFEAAESADGIAEAIQAEKDYIAKLSEAGKVKGLGPTNVNKEKDTEALKESFKKMHPEWDDATLEIAVAG